MDKDERKEALSRAISAMLAQAGGNSFIESRSDFRAIVVTGKKHQPWFMHLVLTFCTFGLWMAIWIIDNVFMGQRRWLVEVDEEGFVTKRKIGRV